MERHVLELVVLVLEHPQPLVRVCRVELTECLDRRVGWPYPLIVHHPAIQAARYIDFWIRDFTTVRT